MEAAPQDLKVLGDTLGHLPLAHDLVVLEFEPALVCLLSAQSLDPLSPFLSTCLSPAHVLALSFSLSLSQK